jgi:two-component system sensor histidine kinase KdpD
VLADAGLLERVVANLVENAQRYNPPGVPVELRASAHGSVVELLIVDHGPGIPELDRESVFAAFQRRDDRAVSTGAGVGLGLAIARGFMEAMHGSIALETSPGGGLMVVLSLPVAEGTGISNGVRPGVRGGDSG